MVSGLRRTQRFGQQALYKALLLARAQVLGFYLLTLTGFGFLYLTMAIHCQVGLDPQPTLRLISNIVQTVWE